MLDIRELRQDGEAVAATLALGGCEFDLAAFRALDSELKQADVQSQSLQDQRKAAAKEVGQLIQSGLSVDEAKAKVASTLAQLVTDQAGEVARAEQIIDRLHQLLKGVTKLPQDDVPAVDS